MGESYIKRQEGELQALQALQALQGLQALQAIFMDNFRDLREEVIYLLKGNWLQNFPFLCPNTYLLGQRILNEQINDILCKTKFSTIFFWRLIDGHFEN